MKIYKTPNGFIGVIKLKLNHKNKILNFRWYPLSTRKHLVNWGLDVKRLSYLEDDENEFGNFSSVLASLRENFCKNFNLEKVE